MHYELYFDYLLATLEDFSANGKDVLIAGDNNIDVLNYKTCNTTNNFIDMLFANGFLQIVTRPTRVNLQSATCIDHFLTNFKQENYITDIIPTLISDHFPIVTYLQNDRHKEKNCEKQTIRSFSENKILDFKNLLEGQNWEAVMIIPDPDLAYEKFSEIFLMIHDNCFPTKEVKFNKNFHKLEKWMTSGLLTSRRSKNNLQKIYFKTPSKSNMEKFKTYRNLYNRLIKEARKIYYNNLIEKNSGNLKRLGQ